MGEQGDEAQEIVERRFGWDITDCGLDDYARSGLFLFTICNGLPNPLRAKRGKL